jgi:hypothetical protein
MTVRKDWLITCRDVFGRNRQISVSAEGDRVVVIGPPGETAILELVEVARLRAALADVMGEQVKASASESES